MTPGEVPATARPYVVMAKPVGSLCNLECSFCYYLKTPAAGGEPRSRQSAAGVPEQIPGLCPRPFRMPDELLERFIRQYIESSPGPVVSFTWHGGEPALAGLDFYQRAVDLQKQYLPQGWNCWNNLQTNGTLLDDEWCAFLAKERFDVGLSVDGTEWLHDKYRKDRQGNGSYQRAIAAVRRLRSHGLQPDLLCTVTADAAQRPLDVYRALRELDTGWIQFIPIVRRDLRAGAAPGEVTPDSVSGRLYGEFLRAVFDEWILHDLGRLDVQLFAETMRVWAGGSASLCWMSPVCGRVLIVERDGGVYSCDHYVRDEYRIGDINAARLGDLADSPAQRRFGEDKRTGLPAQCRRCPWLAACNGGCPKDRFAQSEDGEPGLNHLCEGLRHFFSYARPAADLVAALGKRGLTPEAIMADLRDRLSALWKGVSRNDPCPCGSGRKAKHCCWAKRPLSGSTRQGPAGK